MATNKSDLNIPLLLTIGVVSALLLVIAAIAVDGWYKSEEAEEVAAKWEESPNTWLRDLQAQQKANLNDGHEINRRHFRLAISDAMKIVAEHDGKISE